MTTIRTNDPSFRLRDQPNHQHPKSIPALPQLGLLNVGSHQPRLKLSDYIDKATAQPPAAISRPHPGFAWGMLLNDSLGDCVCAAILHAIESWLLDVSQTPPVFLDNDAKILYEKIGGYNPSDPSSDQGCDEDTAMQDWEAGLPQTSDGVVHTLAATVAVDPTDTQELQIGVDEFDGVFDGIDLPVTAQGQTEWDVVGDPDKDPDSQPGSWGGHATYTREYDAETWALLTWGEELLETVRFRPIYHSQAFVLVPKDVQKSGTGPSGVQWDDLLSDINKLPPVQAPAA